MTERELSRGAARRLAIIQHVEEVTGNVALTCRYFGISRHTYYHWLRRPLVCPHATKAEVVGKIPKEAGRRGSWSDANALVKLRYRLLYAYRWTK